MDIKEKINDIKETVTDKKFQKDLKKDPVKAIEKATGIDLPNDKIDKAVDTVKDKVKSGDIKDKVDDIVDKFKK